MLKAGMRRPLEHRLVNSAVSLTSETQTETEEGFVEK